MIRRQDGRERIAAGGERLEFRGGVNEGVGQFLDRASAKVGDVNVLIRIHGDAGGIAEVAKDVGDDGAVGRDPLDNVVVEAVGHIDVSGTVHETVPRGTKPAPDQRGQRQGDGVPFSQGIGTRIRDVNVPGDVH